MKAELRSRLLGESLNSLMRIRMKGLSITNFDKDYSSQCVSHWCGSKACWIGQKKQKKYEAQKAKKKQRPNFKIDDLDSDSSYVSSSDEEWFCSFEIFKSD